MPIYDKYRCKAEKISNHVQSNRGWQLYFMNSLESDVRHYLQQDYGFEVSMFRGYYLIISKKVLSMKEKILEEANKEVEQEEALNSLPSCPVVTKVSDR